jgi:YD repeat-containing protein
MVDGRLLSSTSATGLTTTYGYDGPGRRITTTDPRTGASETHYDAQGRVDYVKDAAGNQTSFGYDASTGRKIRETNALGKQSYFAYAGAAVS